MNKFRIMPIVECGEPLVTIPKGLFVLASPHPYVAEGAPYEGASPWMLRKGVFEALVQVQENLRVVEPTWSLFLADAYRPNRVQEFMVEKAFREAAVDFGFNPKNLAASERLQLEPVVHRLWARASEDITSPPPHSTGAAVDLSFAGRKGDLIFMGSAIDANSDESFPNYFKALNPLVHERRELLQGLMAEQKFRQSNDEWWHFSLGDQFWAFYEKEKGNPSAAARYGRGDLVLKL